MPLAVFCWSATQEERIARRGGFGLAAVLGLFWLVAGIADDPGNSSSNSSALETTGVAGNVGGVNPPTTSTTEPAVTSTTEPAVPTTVEVTTTQQTTTTIPPSTTETLSDQEIRRLAFVTLVSIEFPAIGLSLATNPESEEILFDMAGSLCDLAEEADNTDEMSLMLLVGWFEFDEAERDLYNGSAEGFASFAAMALTSECPAQAERLYGG